MSNTYLIYTEMFIDGEWRCIDGSRMHKSYGRDEEKMTLFCTYENGSRSYFGSTYEELKTIGTRTNFTKLSKEIQAEHPKLKYWINWAGDSTEEEASYITVSYEDFKAHVPNRYSRHAIIHKDRIADYESGEVDELWEDDEIDYSNLSDLQKQCYQYYEWDDRWSWQYWFKKLKDMVDYTVRKYSNNEWLIENNEVRIVVFCL